MALSPDGRTLATGSQFQLLVWDMPDGTKRHTVDGFKLPIHAMDFSRDGKLLAVGHRIGKTRLISIYDTETWDKTTDIEVPGDGVAKICFSPDGKLLAAGNFDGLVQLWQVDGWKPLGKSIDHKRKIPSLEFSPDRA
jgi:WD40 repeat protein